jgi:hypothetical protein
MSGNRPGHGPCREPDCVGFVDSRIIAPSKKGGCRLRSPSRLIDMVEDLTAGRLFVGAEPDDLCTVSMHHWWPIDVRICR